ncbi:hypothetical protein [Primorskyibacter sp. 2E233]
MTETDRLSIVREQSQGVPAGKLAAQCNVSLKSIYNAANHDSARHRAI